MIPKKLQHKGINFVLLEKGGKKPFEMGWQKKKIEFNDPRLMQHLVEKGNYGVRGGGDKKLLVVDFDDEKVQEECLKKLPDTFKVKTGSGLLHLYYFSDSFDSFKIFDENMNTLADIQGEGKQVVCSGSIHPNGNPYEVFEDKDIVFIPYSELKAILMPYDKKPKKEKIIKKEYPKIDIDENFIDIAKSNVCVYDILNLIGVDITRNPTECPFHSSKGGKCFGFERDVAHCFHCDDSWNIFSLVTQYKNCDFKTALEFIADNFGLKEKYDECKKKYIEKIRSESKKDIDKLRNEVHYLLSQKNPNRNEATELMSEYVMCKYKFYSIRDDKQDETWVYQDGIYIPNGKSVISEFCRKVLLKSYTESLSNQVYNKVKEDTKINADDFFKYDYPDEVPVLNGILNTRTKELIPFNSKKIFFNKIPVEYNSELECKILNQFFKDVLADENDIKVFYEIIGDGLSKTYDFQKSIIQYGTGANGKGISQSILKKFFGSENCASVSLNQMGYESHSVAELFGKYMNLAGDLDRQALKETGIFKQLTSGTDTLQSKRKYKNDLKFLNFSKMVFACNEFPKVYDTTLGFWRRWIILNYPFKFVSQEEYNLIVDKTNLKIKNPNIFDEITTKEEMSGLLNKALEGLERLRKQKGYSNTKGTEEIKNFWVRKSSPFTAFCIDYIEQDFNNYISKKIIRSKFSKYCKTHKIGGAGDKELKATLQDLFGCSEERKLIGMEQQYVWDGIKFKGNYSDFM
ncbi:hypothetical protein LCGC14_1371150 [marine sediment metagenome]|uniref:SF3 helicase domain-containing protein n=1 Tax=marine sediment metagenome TaxID=412755 RepID=A0A0F9K5Q8_9ZZZZ